MSHTVEEETIDLAKAFMKRDSFIHYIGVELLELTAEKCICRLPVKSDLLNGDCVAQGGSIFTLADYACACVAVAQGHHAPTSNANITFMAPVAEDGVLTVEARLVRAGKTLAHMQAHVTDDKGRLVAVYTATAVRLLDRPLNESDIFE